MTEQGLYKKYKVDRVSDPTGKHAACDYFVLDVTHDNFAIPALLSYAYACRDEHRQLSDDLLNLINKPYLTAQLDAANNAAAHNASQHLRAMKRADEWQARAEKAEARERSRCLDIVKQYRLGAHDIVIWETCFNIMKYIAAGAAEEAR